MKYKLIKEYPGSPKLDTICKYDKNPWSDSNAFTNPVLNPKYYPEFWKPVVEKDYEILSVITNNDKFIEKVYNQESTIEPYWKIYSVKRLSDGEIFTVDDIILVHENEYILDKLYLQNNKLYYDRFDDFSKGSGLFNKSIKKVKQPLFTTEDGVDIFERNNIYWVNINTFEKVNCNKYNDDLGEISIKSLLSKQYECKATGFSTKEKAEEYILLNKPCLSYNEVLNAAKIINKNAFETLKTLIKSKIKQSV